MSRFSCPICLEPCTPIDKNAEVGESLQPCDENETYKCYTCPTTGMRHIKRLKEDRQINWKEVERLEKGGINEKN